jgi:hypothetical protein
MASSVGIGLTLTRSTSLDAGNLVQLIVRGRPESACGYGFVSDISERTQTFGKANVRDDKLAAS